MPSTITTQITNLRRELPPHVTLLAVSKTHPVEAIREAYKAGQRCFGENKVQEILAKAPELPNDIQWHLIGHLQTNKVRSVLPYVDLIQSVDSLKLLNLLNSESQKINKMTKVLLQVHIAQEASKFGFAAEDLLHLFEVRQFDKYDSLTICGLMGMATQTEDKAQILHEFRTLYQLFSTIQSSYLPTNTCFKTLSMGMSNDYPLAIEAGSTLVRIGSTIFGERS